jgi:hypothetical protein
VNRGLRQAIGVGGIALSVVTYVLGTRTSKRTERAIRDDVAAVPHMTAEAVSTMFDSVGDPPGSDDPDRGWESQYAATFGFAPLLPSDTGDTLLVEFPYGAHSGVLVALEDTLFDEDVRKRIRLRGSVMNGTGARFHVREASDATGHEVVTLDYVNPLREGRALATMPTQAVYYRLRDDGFNEVGRGQVYDPVEAPWDIPRAVEPFLSPEWVRQQSGFDE